MASAGERKRDRTENSFTGTAPLLITGVTRDETDAGVSSSNDAPTTAFGAGSSRRDNGRIFTTLLALNYMIGAGILNAPQVG